jgi:hypothetical protein
MTPYRLRQEEQLKKYAAWVQAQGGDELPVQLSTYLQANQQERIKILRDQAVGTVLELGCSWGYVLAAVTTENPRVIVKGTLGVGSVGVDRVEWNILLARILSPGLHFTQADILTGLPFYDDQRFDTVMLPEVLEHLHWPDEVHSAIDTAKRLARRRVIVTVPNGEHDTHEATSFKHQWLPTAEHQLQMCRWLHEGEGSAQLESWERFLNTADFFILCWERRQL